MQKVKTWWAGAGGAGRAGDKAEADKCLSKTTPCSTEALQPAEERAHTQTSWQLVRLPERSSLWFNYLT